MKDQLALFQVSEITVSYQPKKGAMTQITSSEEAYEMFIDYWPKGTLSYEERFVVMYLNRSNSVLGIHTHTIGGISTTIADVRQVFAIALVANASSIVLAHNHPSGQPKPSEQDRALTKKLKEAGILLDIPVIDHLILTAKNGYYSFADDKAL